MQTNVDKVIKTYRVLCQIPSLVSARLEFKNKVISSIWSQRNLERGKTTKFLRTFLIDDNLVKFNSNLPLDVSNELLSAVSPSEKLRAVLREVDSKQYLEIWQNYNLIRTVDLAALDAHGSVYTDAELSSFQWSPDEKKVLYIAEQKPPKTEPFYKRLPSKKDKKEKNDGDESEKPLKGEEYLFKQDWGEQLVGKKQTVIAQYDMENDDVEILEGIPENMCPGQVIYSQKGDYVIGIAYNMEPRKLGLIYCTNRPSTIFQLDFNGNYVELPLNDKKSVKSPRISPDGETLIWLQRNTGGPHHGAMALMKTSLPLTEKSKIIPVVDIVETEIKIENNKKFYGLYNVRFPKRCFGSGNRLLVSTPQKYVIKTYIIDIDSGKITEMEYEEGSQSVLDVKDDLVLLARLNYLKPDQLVIQKLGDNGSIKNITDSDVIPGLENSTYEYLDLSQNTDETVREFSAIYLGPKGAPEKSTKLIVWPHGGPHSCFTNYWSLEASMFLTMGWAILFVNYRGSTGFGEKNVQFLPGRIGQADVIDCVLATNTVLEKYKWLNKDKVGLCGGSHGGFLVTHLSGQFPDKFKAVVARNPVIDVASMSILSDIPDWCYVEAGNEYKQEGEVNDEILGKMRKASPIEHAHKIKAPTLLQIGSKDLRVPYHQGLEHFTRLKANGVKVRMNMYDDNHPLSLVPNEMDNIINTVLWLDQHID